MKYLEDLHDGLEISLGSVDVTKEAIIGFAEKFDPQPFHVDEGVAEKMFGGLIASGFHTLSLGQRLLVDGFLSDVACMASPGADRLRFVRPVFAGNSLTANITVVSSRISESKPDRGLAKLEMRMANENGKTVLTMLGNVIVGRRPAE